MSRDDDFDEEEFDDEIEELEEDEEVSFFDDVFEENSDIPDRYAMPEVDDLLDEVMEILAEARPLPMSATVKVNRDEVLHLLEQIQDRLPEELRAARWLLKERDDFVSKARQEHEDLIEEGRQQVTRMVAREQVVKAAELRARQIISDARQESNTMKRQVEEFCDQRLASIEAIMDKTMKTLRKGRTRLVGSTESLSENEISSEFGQEEDIDITEQDLRISEGRF